LLVAMFSWSVAAGMEAEGAPQLQPGVSAAGTWGFHSVGLVTGVTLRCMLPVAAFMQQVVKAVSRCWTCVGRKGGIGTNSRAGIACLTNAA